MLRRSLGSALGLTLCLSGCSPEQSPSAWSSLGSARQPIVGGVADTTSKAVVAITDSYGGVEEGFCSGALIAPNLVLTARHCVAEIAGDDGESNAERRRFKAPTASKRCTSLPRTTSRRARVLALVRHRRRPRHSRQRGVLERSRTW